MFIILVSFSFTVSPGLQSPLHKMMVVQGLAHRHHRVCYKTSAAEQLPTRWYRLLVRHLKHPWILLNHLHRSLQRQRWVVRLGASEKKKRIKGIKCKNQFQIHAFVPKL